MGVAVAIAGGTASGKSTLVRMLCEGVPGSAVLELDWYYRDQADKSAEERSRTNYDAPDAIELDRVTEDVKRLVAGQAVEAPVYDFAVHTRAAGSRRIEAPPVLWVDGLHALTYAPLREVCALTVFVEVPADVRLIRRIRRDMAERGRSLESVLDQYLDQVRPMHEQWVAPGRACADLVVEGDGSPEAAVVAIKAALTRAGILPCSPA